MMQTSLLTKSLRSLKSSATASSPLKLQRRHVHPSGNLVTETLNWADYLAIRKSRRKWQNAATVPCALAGLIGGATYFGSLETDPTKMIFGIDPFFFYGFCTVGCAGAGAVIGPSLGNALWRFSHRRLGTIIDARDREFYQHVSKNRVDASLQSPTTPIPDYYGEKIGSLKEYRQWLRDQGKYRRKAVLEES